MKIHFCDLCNESVPLVDLDQGRAFLRNGRVICARCELAMSTHLPHTGQGTPITSGAAGVELAVAQARAAASTETGPRAAAEGAASAVATALASVAIIMVAVVSLLFSERLHEVEQAARESSRGLQVDLSRGLAEVNQQLEPKLAAAEQHASAATGQLDKLSQALAAQGELRTSTAAALDARLAAQSLEVGRVRDLEGALASARSDLLAQARRLDELESANSVLAQRFEELAQREPVATLEPAVQPAPGEPAWMAPVRELSNASPTERWSAVDALGKVAQGGESAVIPYLLPMLKDSDTFVRMVTARILGDLKVVAGVGPLIDSLEDREPSVREAALVALRNITGRDLGFDPLSGDGERAKKVKAWRDWWKKAAEDYTGKSG